MQAIYHTNINELTVSFINHLKKQFKNSSVDIVIKDKDDTDYLNSSIKNKEFLEEAIREVNNTQFIQKTQEELGL